MKEIVTRLKENRDIQTAKELVESAGYHVSKQEYDDDAYDRWQSGYRDQVDDFSGPKYDDVPFESKDMDESDDIERVILSAPYSSSFMRDRGRITIDGRSYNKIGKDKWEYDSPNSHVIGGTYTNSQIIQKARDKGYTMSESTKNINSNKRINEEYLSTVRAVSLLKSLGFDMSMLHPGKEYGDNIHCSCRIVQRKKVKYYSIQASCKSKIPDEEKKELIDRFVRNVHDIELKVGKPTPYMEYQASGLVEIDAVAPIFDSKSVKDSSVGYSIIKPDDLKGKGNPKFKVSYSTEEGSKTTSTVEATDEESAKRIIKSRCKRTGKTPKFISIERI